MWAGPGNSTRSISAKAQFIDYFLKGCLDVFQLLPPPTSSRNGRHLPHPHSIATLAPLPTQRGVDKIKEQDCVVFLFCRYYFLFLSHPTTFGLRNTRTPVTSQHWASATHAHQRAVCALLHETAGLARVIAVAVDSCAVKLSGADPSCLLPVPTAAAAAGSSSSSSSSRRS